MKTVTALQNFNCRITATVSLRKAIQSTSNVSGWWATNVQGNSQNPDDIFTVRFGKTFSIIKVAEIITGKKIVWQIVDSYLPLFKNARQWNKTKIVWELSEKDNSTEISMTHVGLTPEVECYYDCEKGWSFYVKESLFNLMTTGRGFPGTGIFANIISGDKRYEGLLFFRSDPIPDYPETYLVIDVKETKGEQVISAYSINHFNKQTFDPKNLNGDYFMVLENKSFLSNNILDIIN